MIHKKITIQFCRSVCNNSENSRRFGKINSSFQKVLLLLACIRYTPGKQLAIGERGHKLQMDDLWANVYIFSQKDRLSIWCLLRHAHGKCSTSKNVSTVIHRITSDNITQIISVPRCKIQLYYLYA